MSTSFKSWFGDLEDTGGSCLWFCILILIQIWSLVFGTPMVNIWAFYLDFYSAKNIYVLKVLIWGFGGHWKFLTEVHHIDLDSDMVIGLWYTLVQNFCSVSWYWRCKGHPCPLGPDLVLWRTLEDLDWALASSSFFGYCHWSLIYTCSKFWLSIWVLKVQRTSISFKS